GERRARDDERRRAVELQRLRGAGAFLEPRECRRAEHAEPPGLREVVRRSKARDVEQLEQLLARHRLRAERLVRAPLPRKLGERHARRALIWTSAPARFSSWENGQPSSAFTSAACRASSPRPSTCTIASTWDATIWWPCPSTSSMWIVVVTSR